ncbi:MAG: hypothetical protein PHT02_08915 [Tissierellia bacterium]|nr:hypothetical protein [Tissierellia bacterium]
MFQYIKNKKGANLIIVIMLFMLFMVIAAALPAVASFGINSGVVQRNYTQAYYAAKSINMSICDAIVQGKLPIIKQWESEFEEAFNAAFQNESHHDKDENGEIIRITIPNEKLNYSNGNGYKDEIEGTGIEVINKLTLKYIRESNLTYKVDYLIVETSAVYNNQEYTIKSRILNEEYSSGGGGSGSGGYKGKYVLGSTGNFVINNATYIGGLLSNENINMQGIKVEGGVYSTKDITVQYDGAKIAGGVYSNKNITLNEITTEGDIIAGNKITIGSAIGIYRSNLIAENIDILGQAASLIDGSLIAKNKIYVTGTNVPISGNVVSLGIGGVEYTQPVKVSGSIISKIGKVILGNGGTVGGSIVAAGDVNISSSHVIVSGDIISNGNVTISRGATIKGNIIAIGNVNLVDVDVEGNVISGGNVTFSENSNTENILSNGAVTLNNDSNITNITSNGNIETTAWNVSITGEVRTKGTITTTDPNLINNITIISEDNPTFNNYQIDINPDGGLLYKIKNVQKSFNPTVEIDSAVNAVLTTEIISGIASMGTVSETPSFPFEYENEPPEDKINKSFPLNKMFDASQGDLFYEISNNIIIDDGYTIEGEYNVFIKLTGNTSQTITFLTNRKDEAMAKRLYIISDSAHKVKIHKNDVDTNWQDLYGTIVNAQIYMPKGKVDFYWRDVTFNGIIIVNGSENTDWNKDVLFNLIHGNYVNTNLKPILGGGLPVDINKGNWNVERYYR